MTSSRLNEACLAADARIRSHPDESHPASLLVARHGEIVFERYYRDCGPNDLRSVHSVTKSFVSTLVGILVSDGLVTLQTPVASLVAAPAFSADAAKAAITVKHLLSMSCGLDGGMDGDQHWDIDTVRDRGEPLVEGVLQAPLVAEPGQVFSYNNGAAHVLSAVIEAVAGKPAGDVAAELLFGPLEIERWEWPTDAQGCHLGAGTLGAGSLRLTARDLIKLGLLYLGGGTWQQARVLDEAYVKLATSALRAGAIPERCSYGLLWWVADEPTTPMYFAAGHGGQYVVVAPELNVVVVTVVDVDATPRPPGMALRRLVMETIVPGARTH